VYIIKNIFKNERDSLELNSQKQVDDWDYQAYYKITSAHFVAGDCDSEHQSGELYHFATLCNGDNHFAFWDQ
jgi:hypothetical protein